MARRCVAPEGVRCDLSAAAFSAAAFSAVIFSATSAGYHLFGERTLMALSSGAQHGASSHAIRKREGLQRVVVKVARQSLRQWQQRVARPARPISAATSRKPGRESAADTRRAHHGAWEWPVRTPS